MANGGGPCGPADWFDMTRDFEAHYAEHRTGHEEVRVKETRIRTVRGVGEARITFTSGSVGKGVGEDARRIAAVFVAWRHEVYGDKGTLTVRTGERTVVTEKW